MVSSITQESLFVKRMGMARSHPTTKVVGFPSRCRKCIIQEQHIKELEEEIQNNKEKRDEST